MTRHCAAIPHPLASHSTQSEDSARRMLDLLHSLPLPIVTWVDGANGNPTPRKDDMKQYGRDEKEVRRIEFITANREAIAIETLNKIERQAKAITKSERSRMAQREMLRRQRDCIEGLIAYFGQTRVMGEHIVVDAGDIDQMKEAFRLLGLTRNENGVKVYKPLVVGRAPSPQSWAAGGGR